MIMKWLNFNSIIGMAVLSLLFYTENVAAQTDKNDTKQKIDTIQTTQPEYSKYDKRIHRFRKGWTLVKGKLPICITACCNIILVIYKSSKSSAKNIIKQQIIFIILSVS